MVQIRHWIRDGLSRIEVDAALLSALRRAEDLQSRPREEDLSTYRIETFALHVIDSCYKYSIKATCKSLPGGR